MTMICVDGNHDAPEAIRIRGPSEGRLPWVGFRGQAALVQLAAFLGGGVLGPVWHLAHHQNDHSHGADGQAIAFDLGGTAAPAPGHPSAPRVEPPAGPPAAARSHRHRHRHAHPHRAPHAHAPRAAAEPRPQVPPVPPSAPAGGPQASPVPPPLDHGHGSLAHLGLALLAAPALLPLPTPEPGEWVRPGARIAALTLFRPSFPLPRPPPPARAV
jgi:hypothetical protein